MLRLIAVTFFIAGAGCCTTPAAPAPTAPTGQWTPEGQPGWPSTLSQTQAEALSPDEAKAILVVRAHVEAADTTVCVREYRVSPTHDGNGWDVMVSAAGYDRNPETNQVRLIYTAGGFVVYQVDRNWKIVKTTGGA